MLRKIIRVPVTMEAERQRNALIKQEVCGGLNEAYFVC